MKKMSTLFSKDKNDLGRVIPMINPENDWVFDGKSNIKVTRKWDGTACSIIDGELYKRYDAKHGKKAPLGAIPCQEADLITGHHPHWVKCDRLNNADNWHFEAFDYAPFLEDGTYELCGPKIQGNPEKLKEHRLIKHGASELSQVVSLKFDVIKSYLSSTNIEGIVIHNLDDDRMCKIRKSDFGFKR